MGYRPHIADGFVCPELFGYFLNVFVEIGTVSRPYGTACETELE